jgi:hypothetical protein
LISSIPIAKLTDIYQWLSASVRDGVSEAMGGERLTTTTTRERKCEQHVVQGS